MNSPDTLKNSSLDDLDPDGGVLSLTFFWRSRPEDPFPDFPGEKLSTQIYIPTRPEDPCPCDSGKHFAACCQRLPYWRPVCPNPDLQGYSLLRSQSALFTDIPDNEVYAFLEEKEHLHCVDDTPQEAMWLYWGHPAFKSSTLGIYCFGDFTLKKDHTLMITALSDIRMQVVLDLLHPLELGAPRLQREPFPRLEKPARQSPQSKRRRR